MNPTTLPKFRDKLRQAFGGLAWASMRDTATAGAALVYLIGVAFDAMLGAAITASRIGKVAEPLRCASSLALIGTERRLPRYPGETLAEYASRLEGAWEAYQSAGSETTLIAQLAAFGLPNCTIATHRTSGGWVSEEPMMHPVTGTYWWSIFWILAPEGHGRRAAEQGWDDDDWAWDDGHGFDVEMTAAEFDSLRALVRKWKPARMTCDSVVFPLSGGTQVRIDVRST